FAPSAALDATAGGAFAADSDRSTRGGGWRRCGGSEALRACGGRGAADVVATAGSGARSAAAAFTSGFSSAASFSAVTGGGDASLFVDSGADSAFTGWAGIETGGGVGRVEGAART